MCVGARANFQHGVTGIGWFRAAVDCVFSTRLLLAFCCCLIACLHFCFDGALDEVDGAAIGSYVCVYLLDSPDFVMKGNNNLLFIGCFCVTVLFLSLQFFEGLGWICGLFSTASLVAGLCGAKLCLAGIVGCSTFNARNMLEWINDTQLVSSFFCHSFLLHPRVFSTRPKRVFHFSLFFSFRVGVDFLRVLLQSCCFSSFGSNCATLDLRMVTSFFQGSIMIVVYYFVFITAVPGVNTSKSPSRLFLDLYSVASSPPASVFKSLQSSKSPCQSGDVSWPLVRLANRLPFNCRPFNGSLLTDFARVPHRFFLPPSIYPLLLVRPRTLFRDRNL